MSSPADPVAIRIGHQEREAACSALDQHLQAGRLDPEEYGDRYARATLARTADELRALFVDLPGPHGVEPAGYGRPLPPPGFTAWAAPLPPAPPRRSLNSYLPASMFWRALVVVAAIIGVLVAMPVLIALVLARFILLPMLMNNCRTKRYQLHYNQFRTPSHGYDPAGGRHHNWYA